MRKNMIFTNNIYDCDMDEYKEYVLLNTDLEAHEVTDETIYNYWQDETFYKYDALVYTLQDIDAGDIVAVADLGLWNGRYNGYKEVGDISKITSCFEDYNTLYIDGWHNLRLDATHHDGTNHVLFRAFKENISDIQKENFLDKLYNGTATKRDISRYTTAIGHYIEEILAL